MFSHLLATKLNTPKNRPSLIPRPRLIAKLNSGLNGRLTLVSAPAGFGKTTLVTDWINQLSTSSHTWKTEHCTWISLDEYDNEPVRFLHYFVAAIQRVCPELGFEQLETLDNSPKPNILAITQDLLNEIALCSQPLLIVFDDYHEIHNEVINQILQTTIDFLPHQVHLVITTRQNPQLSLPRWRARSWLNEITSNDLRFDQTEAGDFLYRTMQLDLSPEAIALLEERTEGWVAGLQLAALSLANADFSFESLQQFGGRDRYIAEYILTEVLDRQPADIQQFLIPTAIFDRFNSDLCAAVLQLETPQDNLIPTQKYQNLIETIERLNLFIIPLDHEGYWYRYHHLFSQSLRQRLERTWSADKIHDLYRRAARWFADHGYFEEAINLALQGEDYAFTARLITDLEIDSLWLQHWGLQLRKWGTTLPSEILQEFPNAAIHIALAHMTRNEINDAIHYIELVREDPRVKAEILLIDSIYIRNRGDISQALPMAIEAARLFESNNKSLYIAAQTQVIVCLIASGDLAAAEDLATSTRQKIQTQPGQSFSVNIQLIQILGIVKEQLGMLKEAERIYLEGIETIQKSGITMPLIGLLQVRLGAIYYQWNDIDRAIEYCRTGLAWGNRTGIADIITQGSLVQVNLAILRQDKAAVDAALDQISRPLDWPDFIDLSSMIRANQAFIDVRLGNLPQAVRWADASGLSLEDQPSFKSRTEYQSLVRIRYEEIRQIGLRNQAPNIISQVDKLIQLGTEHEMLDLAIDGWALKALLLDLQGQMKDAITALDKALDLAFPGGFIRIFVDFGVPMRDLLQKSLAYEPHMVYKRRLLLAFKDERVAPSTSVSSHQDTPITLTSREFEILQLVAAGLSNKAIQESLILSNNTIRTHIKNLYSKLGVNSRTQAVQQARKIKLI
jgi:LuxR family maltose regulon positive regulatory protein